MIELRSFRISTNQPTTTIVSIAEPDPNWRFVDGAGHLHAYALGSEDTLPTLAEVETGVDEDGEPETTLVCVHCHEGIEPGERAGRPTTILSGPVEVTLRWIDYQGNSRTEGTASCSETAIDTALRSMIDTLDAHPQATVQRVTEYGIQ